MTLVGLIGVLGVTFHVWHDEVFDYSDERIGQIAQHASDVLDARDPDVSSIDRSDIEDALPDDADLDRLLILEAASPDPGATLWQLSADDGGSPRCLRVTAPSSDDVDPEWSASVVADVC